MGKKIHLPMKSEWYLMIESGEKKRGIQRDHTVLVLPSAGGQTLWR